MITINQELLCMTDTMQVFTAHIFKSTYIKFNIGSQ